MTAAIGRCRWPSGTGDDEYYGPEGEPFPIGSRLLYVVMTRARHTAHLVVPANSHPLWAPLIAALE
ncbi:hypothetical protein [Streptomyces malaysiensis]|uniref:UvrD-like helicase C-terminal domain-containing protein n=1 Tax=Streptomyces autolyticus TaxID=75293 RepID=A0ABM6H5B8_9ACTN|nr:hypothetical protein [Streptomyces autolyticus]AQA09156.1 hypothetical protein BV401_00030 [Streptomyces autolyticus]